MKITKRIKITRFGHIKVVPEFWKELKHKEPVYLNISILWQHNLCAEIFLPTTYEDSETKA